VVTGALGDDEDDESPCLGPILGSPEGHVQSEQVVDSVPEEGDTAVGASPDSDFVSLPTLDGDEVDMSC